MKALMAGWVGGKSRLAKEIVARIPQHACYVEPFAGGAWVLFRKEPSKIEVINDINTELTTLYRVVRNHLEEFIRHFRWCLVGRDEFQRMLDTPPEVLTDIQRACRFYYVQKVSFGGRGRNFGYSLTQPPRLNLLRIEEDLSAAHMRLARVTIECLPYTDVFRRYDRPETFFYVDPPYLGCEDDYGKGIWARDDFERLADILANLKGRFLLSLGDKPEIRRIFKAFSIEGVKTTYSTNNKTATPARELFITKKGQG